MKTTNKKMMVLLAAMATISSSAFAAGVNNTVTGGFGSEAYGKDNTVTATSAFTVGFKNEVSGANSIMGMRIKQLAPIVLLAVKNLRQKATVA